MEIFFKPRKRPSVINLTDKPERKTKKIPPQDEIKHGKRKDLIQKQS